jgi:peptidoglycan/LPS O-acetylase OafA/YrhL
MTPTGRVDRLEAFPHRNNSLNFLRLVLATLVIVSHAWPIGGFGDDPRLGSVSLGHCAVAGFFAISGWLIMQSRVRSELPSFLWRRFLRIYPGFLVALLAVGFVVAPLGSVLGGGTYRLSDGLRYVLADAGLRMREYAVGTTPAEVPYPRAWNGSLWTLFYEALCYLLVALLVTVVARRWLRSAVVLAWLGLSGAEVALQLTGLHVPNDVLQMLQLAPYFFAGAVLFVLRGRLPLHPGWAAGATVCTGLALGPGHDLVLASLPLAYLLLWLGARLPFPSVGRRNDISYGMYIYAFPVQQLLVLLNATGAGVLPYVVASIACTVPPAIASWFMVERPALRFKEVADEFPFVRSGFGFRRRSLVANVVVAD